jgi:hypothetical protein
LSQPAREEPLDEAGLLLRGAAEELAEDLLAPGRRSASSHLLDLRDRAIELVDGQGRLSGRRAVDAVDRRVANTDSALPRHAREETDGERNFLLVEPLQQLGEDRYFSGARAGVRDLTRGGDNSGEQGHSTVRFHIRMTGVSRS